jgi:hypothetical protein
MEDRSDNTAVEILQVDLPDATRQVAVCATCANTIKSLYPTAVTIYVAN